MKRRRRLVLQSLAAVLTSAPGLAGAVPLKADESGSASNTSPLRALVDTLIPEDATPASSAFGMSGTTCDGGPPLRRVIISRIISSESCLKSRFPVASS